MQNFTWQTPTRVHFGKNQISVLPEEVARFGRRVLLAYGGGSIKRSGLYDKVKALLADCEIVELSGIAPNPRVESAREGARLCREHNVDVIVAVGGGSVLDCVKLVSAAAHYDGDAWDLVMNHSLAGKCTPIISVMTLAATGSELDCTAVISNPDKNMKRVFACFNAFPAVSILDPTYTETVNAWQTASGASDILSHVFEQYFVRHSSFVTDGFCEAVMRTVVEMAPRVLKNPHDYEARAEIFWASSWGCNGLLALGADSSPWVCHALEHELSAFYDVTHGAGLAVVTPRWLRYSTTPETAPRIARFGHRIFGTPDTGDAMKDAEAAVQALEAFYASIGMPADLEALGVTDRSQIDAMAASAMEFAPMETAFKPLGLEDMKAILRACWSTEG